MPQVKAVDSLFTLCIYCIKNSLNLNVPTKTKTLQTGRWTGSPWFVEQTTDLGLDKNLFQLPTVLLEAIFSSLVTSYDVNTQNTSLLELIIPPQLKKLIAPGLYNEQYLNFFPKLGNLQEIVFRTSSVGDMCLRTIGMWCEKLRVLNIDECSRVTDAGIKWLIYNTAHIRIKKNRRLTELRKTLQVLRIGHTGVTRKGVKMAVEHLQALQYLEHECCFEVLVELSQTRTLDQRLTKNTRKLSFIRLCVLPNTLFQSGTFALAVALCSSLIQIQICVTEGLTDTDLQCLATLRHLRSLCILGITSSKFDEITFDMGVAPVLGVIGSSLENLDLTYFAFVDIWTVIKFCPNLVNLAFLCHCESLSNLSNEEIIQLENNEQGRIFFKELKILWGCYNIESDILLNFLSSPLLEDVNISRCDAFNDEILGEASKKLLLQNLKLLELFNCGSVTRLGLDTLMVASNRLELIDIRFCKNLTLTDVSDLHSQARDKQWKLRLQFEDSNDKRVFS